MSPQMEFRFLQQISGINLQKLTFMMKLYVFFFSFVYIFSKKSGNYTLYFVGLTTVNVTVTLNTTTSVSLSWNSIPGASVYKLLYKKSTASSFLLVSDTIVTTSYTVTDLLPETMYTFRY